MLTVQQQKALDLHRYLSVTANAGAGKTTVLVQRFINIVSQTSTPVNEIVAITYTEKAASELRKKIADGIEAKIARAPSPAERMQFENIRTQLSSASICTIHSFCAQLLREYPVEAGVDVAFTVLEEIDRQVMYGETIREAFETVMRLEESDAEREEFLQCVRMLGRQKVESYLETLLKKREDIDRRIQAYYSSEQGEKNILEGWKRDAAREIIAALDRHNAWVDSLGRIIQSSSGPLKPKAEELLDGWKKRRTNGYHVSELRELFETIFTGSHLIKKQFTGSADMDLRSRDVEVVLHAYVQHEPLLKLLASDEAKDNADGVLFHAVQVVLRLYHRCSEIYRRMKTEQGSLDFDDLQLEVRKLLSDVGLREKICGKYRFIMIDEFQDTNSLQYEIVKSLLADFARGNLFIVGDPKQSIYGFRNAEVGIFRRAAEEIAERAAHDGPFVDGELELSSTAAERRGKVILPESFRLLPSLVIFINSVFRRIMDDSSSSFDVEYDNIVKGRDASAEGVIELLLAARKHDTSSVRQPDKEESDIYTVHEECRNIAERIAELYNEGHSVYEFDKTSNKEVGRPFRFSDAAVLLRNRKHVRELERALQKKNIPYLLTGGIGFYQTQEIYDFYNYFRFLLSPEDDIALAGILRSPFFIVSDAELYEVTRLKRGVSLWENVQTFAVTAAASSQLQQAARILRDDLLHVNRLTVPFLVERIFLQTGWRGTTSGLSSGDQSRANMRKLLSIVRKFEEQGYKTLYDFVERLKLFVEEHEREGQAALDMTAECVHVMTIHSAKGLEFPVVILPFTHEGFRYDSAPYIDSKYGIAFKVKNPGDLTEELTPHLYSFLSHRSRLKTEAEEKRLLYVACTRARDMLIISGNPNSSATKSNYLHWIFKGLGVESADLLQRTSLVIAGEKSDNVQSSEPANSSQQCKIDVRFLDDKMETEFRIHRERTLSIPKEILVAPILGQRRGEIFSATHVRTFLECPSKYFLKYQLGLPELRMAPHYTDEEEEPNDKLFGEREGVLAHAVLQHLSGAALYAEKVREEVIRSINLLSPMEQGAQEELINAVYNHVVNFQTSDFGMAILSCSESKTEFTMSTVFGEDYITGTVDRLYYNGQQWNILDYKTDYVGLEDIPNRAMLYKSQLAVYAMLVAKYFHQDNVRASIVFLRHPQHPVHYVFGQNDFAEFTQTLTEVIRKIKKGDFNRSMLHCHSCTYFQNGSCIIPPTIVSG